MRKEIKYISYFDFADSTVQRNFILSCTNKMESICECLNRAGYDVKIVSISEVVESKFRLYHGCTIEKRPGLKLKVFTSWGGNGKWLKRTKLLWHLWALFVYLLLNTHKNEPVLVYHSLGYFNVVKWAKKIRKFKLVLEVEEIYQDVAPPKYGIMAKAENQIFKMADSYIFPTELLDKKLNTTHKPSTIIYGTYHVETQCSEKFDDGYIHVVYAGTFDPRKGAPNAIAASAYLPANYHIHICGFGTQKETDEIKRLVREVSETSKAKVSYNGLLKGHKYIEFIQQCHIGLSTQDPQAGFNATSFPSKILSYMANGLEVVSIEIPAIKHSKISSSIHFYKEQTPLNIAKAIMDVNVKTPNDNRALIGKLCNNFIKDLPKIL